MPITLPDSGTANSAEPALQITQEGTGDTIAASAKAGIAVSASSEGKVAVVAKTGHPQGAGLIADGAVGVVAQGKFAGVLGQGKVGVYGVSEEGTGVGALSTEGVALKAQAITGLAVHARSHGNVGVFAESKLDNAVIGQAQAAHMAGLFGYNAVPEGIGAVGLAEAKGGIGVVAQGDRAGVQAGGGENAIVAEAARGTAVIAIAHGEHGVFASTASPAHTGVTGRATSDIKEAAQGAGVHGESALGSGVRAVSDSGAAFEGHSKSGPAALLESGSQGVPAVTIKATSGATGLAVTAAGRGGLAIVRESSFNLLTGDAARINTPSTMTKGIVVGPGTDDEAALSIECPPDKVGLLCYLTHMGTFGGNVSVINGDITAFPGSVGALTPSTSKVAVTGRAEFGGYSSDGGSATGVYGTASYLEGAARAILGMTSTPHHPNQYAGVFFGNVRVFGTLYKSEDCFEIDHPQRPAQQFLRHVAVESDERRTVYDGEVTLDRTGAATVALAPWFASLNTRPRFQLTAIGRPAPNLHVAETDERRGSFQIAGGTPGLRVCWQVTAVRHDLWAQAHPFQVEVDKDKLSLGKYISPVEHGVGEELGLMWPELEAMRAGEAERGKTPSTNGDPKAGAPDAPAAPRGPSGLAKVKAPTRPSVSELPKPPDLTSR